MENCPRHSLDSIGDKNEFLETQTLNFRHKHTLQQKVPVKEIQVIIMESSFSGRGILDRKF